MVKRAAHEQVRRRAPAGLVLEVHVGQRVAVAVADDVAVLAKLGVRAGETGLAASRDVTLETDLCVRI
jgi:hypothetical protein